MEIASLVISGLSLVVAIYAIWSSKVSAKKQQEFEERMEKSRKQEKFQEERQNELDWKDAERRARENPFPIIEGNFDKRVENCYREVRSERILNKKG